MSIANCRTCGAADRATTFLRFIRNLLPLAIGAAMILSLHSVRGDEPEEVYLPIFNLIQEGDALKNQGETDQAIAKYQTALTGLRNLQLTYPSFNVKMVSYRSNDVALKISALTTKPASPPEAERTQTTPTALAPAKGSGGSGSFQVKLLNAGAEPRKQLRLHPKTGDKQSLSMVIKMNMGMKMGETETPVKLPAMTMNMDSTVKEIKPDGDIAYETLVSDATVADDPDALAPVVEAMKNAMSGIKGMTGTGTISSRGISKGFDLKLPEGADSQMKQTMDQMKESFSRMSAPLPEEPVGTGAKWSVKMPVSSQGINIDQTATYELVSIAEEKITTKSTIVQSAANQKIQNPAMPGLKLDLTKMTGSGTGESSVNLAQLLPTMGTMELHSELSMGMDTGGAKQAMNMKLDMSVRVEAK